MLSLTIMHHDESRITGEGILPLKQGLIDIQAQVLQTHCPLFEYEGRAFLISGSAPTQYSYRELLQLKGNALVCNARLQLFLVPALPQPSLYFVGPNQAH